MNIRLLGENPYRGIIYMGDKHSTVIGFFKIQSKRSQIRN